MRALVQSLFHETLQQVFCSKPEDPLKFVVGYLQNKLEQRDATVINEVDTLPA